MLSYAFSKAQNYEVRKGERKAGDDQLTKKQVKQYLQWYKSEMAPYDPSGEAGAMDYVKLSSTAIDDAFESFENNSAVQIVHASMINGILGGGIAWSHGSGKPFSDESIQFHTPVYSKFIRRARMYDVVLGWIPMTWKPHDEYNGVPAVLDLSGVDVYYRRNIFGDDQFVFVQRASGLSGAASKAFWDGRDKSNLNGRIIPNVYVWVRRPPTPGTGKLNSVITRNIEKLSKLEHDMMQCTKSAMGNNANVPFVTEQVIGRQEQGASAQTSLSMSKSDSRYVETLRSEQESKIAHIAAAKNQVGVEQFEAMVDESTTRMLQAKVTDTHRQIDIENGRKYVAPALSQQPADMIPFMVFTQQVTFLLLGIPPALLQPESTRGKITENQSDKIYNDHMRQLKQEIQEIVASLFHVINDAKRVAEYVALLPMSEKVENKKAEIRDILKVEIRIPGIPAADVINSLYLEGSLTFEAYVLYQSQSHLIPITDFNKKPAIELLDLIGQGKNDSEGSGVKAKPKAKKQTSKASKSKKK